MNSVPRYTFGPRLRTQRERLGISLEQIADSTKIGISLLAALERNDVSHWPKGVFRRAFFKAYTGAIKLPFEATWAEFQQTFPEDGSPGREVTADGEADPLRLTLARGARYGMLPGARQLLTAALDTAAVLLLAALVAVVGGAFWTATGVIALLWFAGSMALLGSTPGARLATARLGSGDPGGTTVQLSAAPADLSAVPTALPLSVDAPTGAPHPDHRLTLERPGPRATRPIGLASRRASSPPARRGRDEARPS